MINFKKILIIILNLLTIFSITICSATSNQNVVFIIDNSHSMLSSDPDGIRGVTANLIMDGAELVGELRAGIVFFNHTVQADTKLDLPRKIRSRLQAENLPKPQGGTNLKDAIEAATNLLNQDNNVQNKKIIMITDGYPCDINGNIDKNQIKSIQSEITPRLVDAGIKLYALGFKNADKTFLDSVCTPTGGTSIFTPDATNLLLQAKQLLGQSENIHVIGNMDIPNGQNSFSFNIPKGIDRVRITLALKSPTLFLNNQLNISIKGPGVQMANEDGLLHTLQNKGLSFIAAWTSVFTPPNEGNYEVSVESKKGGFQSHQGLRFIAEGRSDLKMQIDVSPKRDLKYFIDEVLQINVGIINSAGSIIPDKLEGRIITKNRSTVSIDFKNMVGQVAVPSEPGKQSIEIKATIKGLPPLYGEFYYSCIQAGAPELHTNPERINFQKLLGPETPVIKERFTISPIFPEENPKRKAFNIFARFNHAPGIYTDSGYINLSEWFTLSDNNGHSITIDGKKQFLLSVNGLDLELKAKFPESALKILSGIKGKHVINGILEIGSIKSQGNIYIPININIRIPSFELINASTSHALWWNRKHERTFHIGAVLTDYQKTTNFSVSMPRFLRITKGPQNYLNRPIAELKLLNEDRESITGDISGDKVIYPDMQLSRKDTILFLKVIPLNEGSQCLWSFGSQSIPVSFISEFGTFKQNFLIWTLGEPLYSFTHLPSISLYGNDIVKWLLIAFLSLLLLNRIKYLKKIITQQKYHCGREFVLPLPATIGIGSNAAFNLPGNYSEYDGQILGQIKKSFKQVLLTGTGSGMLINTSPLYKGTKPLKSGDIIYLGGDDDENSEWGLEIVDIEPSLREIEIEIIESPFQRGIFAAFIIAALSLTIWLGIYKLFSTEFFSSLVHNINFFDVFYLNTIIPFFG